MRTLPLLCAVLSGLAACSSPSAPSGPDGGHPAQELARNQQQFHAMVGDTYRVTFENHCFCPVEVLPPVRLTVRDGAISEVTRLSDGTEVPRAEWRAYRTVDDVFAEIAAGISRGAQRVAAEYDGRYGYPHDVLIAYQMAADAFVGFRLSDLDTLR
jgi:Family of unknown function (DUF6174)